MMLNKTVDSKEYQVNDLYISYKVEMRNYLKLLSYVNSWSFINSFFFYI